MALISMGFSFSGKNGVSFIPVAQSMVLFLSPTCASGSNGNNGNVPFLVMSEIVHNEGNDLKGGKDIANHSSSNNINDMSEKSDESNICKDSSTVKTSHERNYSSNDSHNGKKSIGINTSNGGGAGWSDTDDDDADNNDESIQNSVKTGGSLPHSSKNAVPASSSASAVSQPLKTLKKLQAMLDDTDYATTTLASSSVSGSDPDSAISSRNQMLGKAAMPSSTPAFNPTETSINHDVHMKKHSNARMDHDYSQPQKSDSNASTPPESDELIPEKLWTSKDRSKYRRTRRTEKQRQQRDYDEQRAREIREIQRQRIIREERERNDLEELRRKQLEELERERQQHQKRQQMKQQLLQHDQSDLFFEETDFAEETDTDGKGFELPNLPVYLSDAEQTDDFSEEADDNMPVTKPHSNQPPGFSSPMQQTQQSYRPLQMMHPPYQYPPPLNQRYNYPQHEQQLQQQLPPQSGPYGPYPDYRQHSLPPQQQKQQQQQQQQKQNQGQFSPYSQGPRYQFNDSDQQVQDQIRRYEQQYAAWNQAARNGYYYPPPIYPATFASQHPQASQSHQNTDSSYPNYPYEHQQQQQQQQQRQPLDDDRRIFYGSPLQRPFNNNYHMHHYHPSISSHSLRPPSLHASHAATNYQAAARGFFVRDMNDSPDRFQQRQELQQYNYPPSIVPDGTEQSVQYNSVDNKNSAHAANDLSSIGNAHDNSVKQTTALSPLRDTLQQGDIIVSSESNTVNGPNLQQQNQLILATPDKVFGPVIAEGSYSELADESAVTIEGAESKMNFDSFQKLSFSFIGVTLLAYCAVSPRSLPVSEYNSQFLQNLSIVWLSAIAPIFSFLCIYDGKYNNINTAIGTFYVSFTVGYALAFILEIVVTTFLRLGVFMIWEPSIFSLTPRVPSIILPWVLREKQYRPKRITLFAADFATSCVACPIIEEYLKLKTVQWTCKLPRNFKPSKKISKGKKRNRKNALQPVVRRPDKPEVININCYVSQMMASSLGLKLFDTFRRVLMYTKRGDDYKQFYAVCRGLFPIHELCGTMTALMLARRDILGIKMPLWKILGPAVFIHGMANFRGMKPIFKWNSSTPWSEMQLYPW
eukprot:CAMPEP_0171354252 /NCGR_PEP_ID=MMETSP0878-20121228/44612_1 /TAXON_ID=67004 /ORGANISM="Thalassiosira weissflogii, Strain CCMP1336" /LENGTH=1093 /DNA_ID=CAMNT_0011860221 /DNA_START=306 /DNA_END=3584 /DNA_ORIENTATION=+